MSLITKINNWFRESNRWKHFVAGICIHVSVFLCVLLVSWWLGVFTYMDKLPLILALNINAFFAVLCSMLSVEYIQKSCGMEWDWVDVFAGIIPSLFVILSYYVSMALRFFFA